jgi:mono/diheme cytochrome c family protein
MDVQPKYKSQSLVLDIPTGTVAYGRHSVSTADASRDQALKEDDAFYRGKTSGGQFVSRIPAKVDAAFLNRGQERYDIYCSVCHDRSGGGRGMVAQRGFTPPPLLWDPRVLAYSDGQLFDVISNGVRTMPGYGKQIPEKDRWAIVAYVRALQKSNTSSPADVPESQKHHLKSEGK